MAAHSSILAWRIPWTEEPEGYSRRESDRTEVTTHTPHQWLRLRGLKSDGLVIQPCLTLAIPWTLACEASLCMGFSRQEYWSEFPSLLQGIFLTQG